MPRATSFSADFQGMAEKSNPRRNAAAAPTLPCGRPLPQSKDTASLIEAMTRRLDLFVAKMKLNRSDARGKILETIVKEARHFRAQDLCLRLQARHPEVGRATVYRNLPVLVDAGLLQEGPRDSDGQVLYELADDEHHDHIVCLDCRNIFEFHDDSIEDKQARASKKLGFTVRDHRHVVYASCDFLARQKK